MFGLRAPGCLPAIALPSSRALIDPRMAVTVLEKVFPELWKCLCKIKVIGYDSSTQG